MAEILPSLRELSPALSRRALMGRLTRVLRFAQVHVSELDRHAPFWPPSPSGLVTQADKVVVETALLALLASRVSTPGTALATELAAIVSLVAPLARSEPNQVRLLRFPQTAASLGIAHICLTRLGHRDERFDALIRGAFSSGHVDAIERLPYRAMDLAWLRGIHGADEGFGFEGPLASSILASCAHPVCMAEMDVYALTHALMYLTDFGARPLPGEVDRARVSAMVDACLAWQLLSANMDLIGELLVSAALLGNAWSPYARLAIGLLLTVWDEFGFLPSASFDVARFRELSGDEARAYTFHHVYHTTYVAGILCQVLLRCPDRRATQRSWQGFAGMDSALLSRGDAVVRAAHAFCRHHSGQEIDPAPPQTIETTLTHTVAQIRRYPGGCARPGAPWTSVVAATAMAPADLGLVLNDALLIQAARDYNLSALVAALLERAASALPVSRTLLETTAFLCRQQLPSGAIGAHFVVPQNSSSPQSRVVTAIVADALTRTLAYVRAQGRNRSQPAIQAGGEVTAWTA